MTIPISERIKRMTTRPLIRGLENVHFLANRQKINFQVTARPHLDDETLSALRQGFKSAKGYLEYGAGGSTILAASEFSGWIYTVESDPIFLGAVRDAMPHGHRATLRHVDIGLTGPWGRPAFPWPRQKWRRYPQTPWLEMTSAPDLILIDGRFRVACLIESLLRLPNDWTGSIILDDYQKRDIYREVEDFAQVEPIGRALRISGRNFDRQRCQNRLERYYSDWN
jgi:hypothetical protein